MRKKNFGKKYINVKISCRFWNWIAFNSPLHMHYTPYSWLYKYDWVMWRRRSDRNCWFGSFCRFCCARVGGQNLQKQLILGSWRYRSYWSSLSVICDFWSSRVGGQNPQNPLKKREFPDEYIFGATRFFSSFCVICLPTLAQQNLQKQL